MEFGTDKCTMFIMKSGKKEKYRIALNNKIRKEYEDLKKSITYKCFRIF